MIDRADCRSEDGALPPRPARSRTALFVLAMALISAATVEAIAWLAGRYTVPRSPLSFALYDPAARVDGAAAAEYFERMDPVLGWPPTDAYGTDRYDATGARPSPDAPQRGEACIAAYGDSYTYSSHVGHGDAWANRLSRRLGCRVANFGVPGYGTDQALLRFSSSEDRETGVAILGIATVDIIRLVNRDRRLIWRGDGVPRFKPRFVLAPDGTLERVAIPAVGLAQLEDYVARPAEYLPHEWYLPDTPGGPATLRFPYTISLLRGLSHPRVWNKLAGRPSWIDFYRADHPSGALELLVAIAEEFRSVAGSRGQAPLVLVIPTSQDLWYARETGRHPSAALIEALNARGIPYLDLTSAVLEHLGDGDVCSVFAEKTWLGYCWGHYNAEGERVVADRIYTHLQTQERYRTTLRARQPAG